MDGLDGFTFQQHVGVARTYTFLCNSIFPALCLPLFVVFNNNIRSIQYFPELFSQSIELEQHSPVALSSKSTVIDEDVSDNSTRFFGEVDDVFFFVIFFESFFVQVVEV